MSKKSYDSGQKRQYLAQQESYTPKAAKNRWNGERKRRGLTLRIDPSSGTVQTDNDFLRAEADENTSCSRLLVGFFGYGFRMCSGDTAVPGFQFENPLTKRHRFTSVDCRFGVVAVLFGMQASGTVGQLRRPATACEDASLTRLVPRFDYQQ
ncbi:hypothetical protein AC579_5249 [Pseudocercospora musae]|uniref:Uncharacterized protein n=1 Tax=Pseudocercospora musae TaxID=113226 RepID=A0A139IQ39_9PEZI|nr:hypothetical protein AC579_5249 [Pseudocercospora musae]